MNNYKAFEIEQGEPENSVITDQWLVDSFIWSSDNDPLSLEGIEPGKDAKPKKYIGPREFIRIMGEEFLNKLARKAGL